MKPSSNHCLLKFIEIRCGDKQAQGSQFQLVLILFCSVSGSSFQLLTLTNSGHGSMIWFLVLASPGWQSHRGTASFNVSTNLLLRVPFRWPIVPGFIDWLGGSSSTHPLTPLSRVSLFQLFLQLCEFYFLQEIPIPIPTVLTFLNRSVSDAASKAASPVVFLFSLINDNSILPCFRPQTLDPSSLSLTSTLSHQEIILGLFSFKIHPESYQLLPPLLQPPCSNIFSSSSFTTIANLTGLPLFILNPASTPMHTAIRIIFLKHV